MLAADHGMCGAGREATTATDCTPPYHQLPPTLPHRTCCARPAVQVSCGGDHSLLVSLGGVCYSWGRGTWGQTGLGSTDNTCRPNKIQGLEAQCVVQVRGEGKIQTGSRSVGSREGCRPYQI